MKHTERFFRMAYWSVVFAGLYFIALLAFQASGGGLDNSDADAFNRSGLRPHRDHLTGCEYFSTYTGGVTPRLTADGRHMGCRHG